MSSNENDPRPGRAEGRKSSAGNRTATSVVALHFNDQCAPCTTLAQQMATVVKVDAPGDVRLGIDCTHHEPVPLDRAIAEWAAQHTPDDAQDLADDPVARILAEHSDVVITISEHPADRRGTVDRP